MFHERVGGGDVQVGDAGSWAEITGTNTSIHLENCFISGFLQNYCSLCIS